MGILTWIVFGAIAGWLASMLAGDRRTSGCITNIVIGILGAIIGGAVFRALGGSGVSGFNLWSMLVAVSGAVILLIILRLLRR